MDLKSLIAKMTAIENNALTEGGGVVDPIGEIRPGHLAHPPAKPSKKPEVKRLEKPLDDTDKKPDEEVDEGKVGHAVGALVGAGGAVAAGQPELIPYAAAAGGHVGSAIGDKFSHSDEEEVEEGWKEKAGVVALAGAAALGGAAPAQANGWDDIMRPVDQVHQVNRDIHNMGRNVGLEVSKDMDHAGRDLEKIPFFGINKFGKQMRGDYQYGAHPEPDRSPGAAMRQGVDAARNAELRGSEAAAGYGVNNNRGYKPYRINNFESKNMSKEEKCTECGMYESKCSCTDELSEMLKLAGRLHPYIIGEAKKKKPDANKNNIPDYAEDGKGKMEEGKKVDEDDVEEGNAFSKTVVDAKKDGVQPGETIKVGGKKYPVKETTSTDLMKRWRGIFESEEKCADCGEVHEGDCAEDSKETVEESFWDDETKPNGGSGVKKGTRYGGGKQQDTDYPKAAADARRPAKTMPLKKDKKPLGENMEECMDGSEGGMDDNFSINSSMDSSGHKSVSITASGSKADELTNILRNAGLGIMGSSEEHAEIGHDEMGDMGAGDVDVVSVPLAQHDGYQAPEHEEEMDEEYSNEPHTQVQSVSSQMHQGNDLNAEKRSHKHSYRQGDNPMAMEEKQAAARLEKELMEELSALKVVSEKYMGFAKTAKAVGSPALAASIGRKKYGKEKFQKAAAAGKKLG